MNDRILGRTEVVSLPEFELNNLPAKIDTGAYSSSVDCKEVKLNGDVLEFVLLNPSRAGYTGKKIQTRRFERTDVTNSNGVSERFVIFTNIKLKDETFEARLTLANRSKLRYPVLVGRKFIRGARYLVDVSKGQGLPGDEEDREL